MRLIDADALKRWIETNKANANPLDYNTKATYAECITMVENMETVDAVPVVRCKDCIFSKTFRTGNMYCELHENYAFSTKPDDYCSFGVKINLEGCP